MKLIILGVANVGMAGTVALNMKRAFLIFFLIITQIQSYGQKFKNVKLDKDTFSGITIFKCPQYGHHLPPENLSHNDSLNCLLIQYFPIDSSRLILCLKTNLYGDTIEVGLKREVLVRKKESFFFVKNGDRPLPSKSAPGEKVGEWYYYHPSGELREKIKY